MLIMTKKLHLQRCKFYSFFTVKHHLSDLQPFYSNNHVKFTARFTAFFKAKKCVNLRLQECKFYRLFTVKLEIQFTVNLHVIYTFRAVNLQKLVYCPCGATK
jgi:hypothetical protein